MFSVMLPIVANSHALSLRNHGEEPIIKLDTEFKVYSTVREEQTMVIGDMKEFQLSQMSKVERCKKEAERIKKGIFQTKVMIDNACTETLSGECDKNQNPDRNVQKEDGAKERQKTTRKPDIMQEMEKMIAAGGRYGQ